MDPDLNKDLVSLGMIKDLKIEEEQVSFTIELTTPSCPLKSKIENDARQAVLRMTEAKSVNIHMSARVNHPKPVTIEKISSNMSSRLVPAKGAWGRAQLQ